MKEYTKIEFTKSVYKVLKSHPDWYLQSLNTDQDHVHMLIEIPPKYAVSKVIQQIKGSTAHELRKRFPYINRIYSKTESIWGTGYFVSTVGLNEETILRYVERQAKMEEGMDITDEILRPTKGNLGL